MKKIVGILSLLSGVSFIGLLGIYIQKYWMDYIILWMDYRSPILENQIVTWTVPEIDNTMSNGHGNKKPNIIVILVDDLGFNDISFYGGGYHNGTILTPNIDSIGKNGISFYQGYAGHGTCAPSRASLMTGRFPTRFGYEFTPVSPLGAKVIASIGSGVRKGIYHPEHAVGRSYDTMTFPTDTITLPKVLKKAGYRTLHFGKWHLGTVNESKSINQGFDETLDFGLISLFLHPNHPDAVNCRFEQEYLDRFLWATVRYVIRKNNGPLFRPAGYMTDYLADEASKAIIANKDHPFFLYFALNAVHSPLQALRSDYESVMHIKDHCSRVYAAMIISLDRAVGKLLRTLSEHNLTDDTIIIFTSDNGAPNYISEPDVNLPFRGWKATLFEGGIRVPFLMQWPKNIPGGIRSHAVVSHTDIFATALSAAGIEREGYHLDGTDLMQNIKPPIGCENISEQYPHHCAFTTIAGDAVKRVLYWKSGHYSAIRYGEWKLQMAGNPQKTWLFNLKDDPTEQHNLANIPKYSAVLKDLIAVLRSQEADQQAEPIWRSVSETPIAIDFTTDHQLTLDDEYVYWPN